MTPSHTDKQIYTHEPDSEKHAHRTVCVLLCFISTDVAVVTHTLTFEVGALLLWTLEVESSWDPSVPTGNYISKNRVGQGWASPIRV